MDAMRAVLRHRDFRLLWLASSPSMLATGSSFLLAGPAADAFGAAEVQVVGGLLGFGVAVAGW